MNKTKICMKAVFTKMLCVMTVVCIGVLAMPAMNAQAAAATISTTTPAAGISTTKTTALNIRKTASASSTRLAGLNPGAYIQVIGTSGDFYKVRYGSSGATAYCSKQYISIVSTDYGKVSETCTALNLRSSYSTKSSVIAVISSGTVLPIISRADNGWYKVVYGQLVGYVSDSYFKTLSTDSASFDSDSNTDSSAADAESLLRSRIVETAEEYLGVYYEWGGDYLASSSSYKNKSISYFSQCLCKNSKYRLQFT